MEPPPSSPRTDTPLPAGGRVPWTGRSRGGRFGNGFFLFMIRHGLLALTPLLLFWVALYFLIVAGQARRASFDLADRVGRGGSFFRRLRFAYRHFFTYGTMLIDRAAILAGNLKPYRFRFLHEETMRRVIQEGRGAVLITGHVGNWHAMGHLLQRFSTPVTLVMFDGVQAFMKGMVDSLTVGRHLRLLYTDGSPASAAAILQALSEGQLLGMMGDRVLGEEGTQVPFLGGEALFPSGPHIVAAIAGVPVLHVFAVRAGRRCYEFRAHYFGKPTFSDPRNKEKDVRDWIEAYARTLEGFVRSYPDQWGNLFPFWLEKRKEKT
jgi:predicted LPLAT superfamily acyltransferase